MSFVAQSKMLHIFGLSTLCSILLFQVCKCIYVVVTLSGSAFFFSKYPVTILQSNTSLPISLVYQVCRSIPQFIQVFFSAAYLYLTSMQTWTRMNLPLSSLVFIYALPPMGQLQSEHSNFACPCGWSKQSYLKLGGKILKTK